MSLVDKNHVDMTCGPLLKQIVKYCIPIFVSGLLMLAFNAADLIIIGQFASSESLAAIGVNSPVIGLMVNLISGLSVGGTVIVAQYFGAHDRRNTSRAVHTIVMLSIICGVGMMLLSLAAAKPILHWMLPSATDAAGAAADAGNAIVRERAFTYLWIYCLSIPFIITFSYVYGILRAVGDTTRPMYYLISAGVINVVLNIIFVKMFNMDVAGVAIATVVSNIFSVILILNNLRHAHDSCRLNFRLLRLHRKYIGIIFRIGIPASLQTSFYSIANIALMSAVAKFGKDALAGNTAACSIEGLLWMSVLAFQQAATSFIGQNYAVGNSTRVRKTIKYCTLCVIPLIAVLGWTCYIFGAQITGFYNPSPEVARYACLHMKVSFTLYFIVATLEVVNGSLRGFGISFRPAVTVFLAICVFRVLWVKFAVPYHNTMDFIYLCYPLSWLLSLIPNSVMLFRALKQKCQVRSISV